MKKILFIMPRMNVGGAERVLLNLLKQIDYDKFEVDLFIGTKGKGKLEKEVPSSVNVNHLFPNKYLRKLTSFLFKNFEKKKMFEIFGKKIIKDYDVGISFLDSLYSEFLFFTKGNIKKKVVVLHSSYISYSNEIEKADNKTLNRLKKRYEKIDTIVSVSHDALRQFTSLFGEYKDMRVIYNPMNLKNIFSQAKHKNPVEFDKNKVNLIAVGNHMKIKGYDKLIRACYNIKKEGIDFYLNILGSGPLMEEHWKMINDLKLTANINLRGYINNPYSWINESDIFVMTSGAEGLPTALCEAMILGKPVLVTNVPGCREVVENGKYGLMVENDIDSITLGLKKLILNEKERGYYNKLSIKRSVIFNDESALKKYYEIFNLA